jgi:hypothetical protein
VPLKLSSLPSFALALVAVAAALADHWVIAFVIMGVAGIVGRLTEALARRQRSENPFKYDREHGDSG